MRRFAVVSLVAFLSAAALHADDPRFPPKFMPKEKEQISPPVVAAPIHECAESVHVTGFVPHATVRVIANGTEELGKDQPSFGFADIALTRSLKLNEKITATQAVGALTSVQSYVPVPVTAYPPGGFKKPDVGKDLYECGHIVPVDKLVPSVKVHVFEAGGPIGDAEVAGTWQPVFTTALHKQKDVTAQQIACEMDEAKTIKSPLSDPVTVKPEPQPLKSPTVDPSSVIAGNDAVAIYDLYVGAEVQVKESSAPIGGGFATAGANWCPIFPPVKSNPNITANQKLCGPPSPDSPPVTTTAPLNAPTVVGPICAGSQFVVVRDTTVNATILLFRNGGLVGTGGAGPGDIVVAIGGNSHWNANDVVTARQSMGNTLSPPSNSVTVVSQLRTPAVEVLGGEPFFLPESGEQAIDGPVFPRGRGAGPVIAVQACCDKKVKAAVSGANGASVADVPLTEVFPGYYTGTWDWHSSSNWKVPDGIPIGPYTVKVTTDCAQEPATKKFYVIFNPDDVSGPSRFSFNETGIWFGSPPSNASFALTYQLHPDDARVFGKAIAATKGETDSLKAAQQVENVEQALFAYSLNYHTQDVLDMLANFTEAQCADDANVLTAMLRSIGIPSHPVTADAALETGAAGWTFDTWVEFLVPGNSGPQWLILHPHQYPSLPPQRRPDFGANQSVATKASNDLVIFADENWVWNEVSDNNADVTYDRNACQEPNQAHTFHAAWLEDLCEQGYWSPNHWDCAGIGTRSASLRAEWRLDLGESAFGGAVSGRLVLRNVSYDRVAGPLVIELVTDLPESKAFPDERFVSIRKEISLEPGQETTIPFKLETPRTFPLRHRPYLHVAFVRGGERKTNLTLAVEPVKIVSRLRAVVEVSGERRVGQALSVKAVVTNPSREAADGVRVRLALPAGLVAAETPKIEPFALKPGAERKISWRVKVTAPLEAGTLRVEATAAVGGWAEAVEPVSIREEVRRPPTDVLRRR
jgi:hypothetical protein